MGRRDDRDKDGPGTRFSSVASTARSKQRRSCSLNSFTFVSPFSPSRRSFETRDDIPRNEASEILCICIYICVCERIFLSGI